MEHAPLAPESNSHTPSVTPPRRTLEEVRTIAATAGLSLSSLPVQVLHFGEHLSDSQLKLMELPPDLLDEMTAGQKVVIRGELHDEALLCTADKTFEMKEAQTSNSLLLCPNLQDKDTLCTVQEGEESLIPVEINSCVFNYFVLRRCRPKLHKLKELLSESLYSGELDERISEENGEVTKYTFNDLLEKVQSSEQELLAELHQLQACHINGYWRLFELDYRDKVFQSILTLLEEEDWSWRSIPFVSCCQKLQDLEPSFAIEHLLKCYGVSRVGEEDGEIRYELLEEKVCQFCAELFLRQSGKFNYLEFMESWPTSVPVGMTTSIEQLRGLALTDTSSVPPVIWYFPASDLPENPAARFSKLFSVKDKWSYEELDPYIRDLISPGQSLNGLLLKYSRVSTVQGKRTYHAKLTAL